jgi:hypothetical protein
MGRLMHPYLRWTLIVFVALMFLAPLLAADIFHGAVDAVQTMIASLKIFGDAVGK